MAYTVPQLLAMSQKELDDLFTSSTAGDIPNGEATGNRNRRVGHRFLSGDRFLDQYLRLAGKDV